MSSTPSPPSFSSTELTSCPYSTSPSGLLWRCCSFEHQRPLLKNPLIQLTSVQARRIWLHAQHLDTTEPFGSGPKATPAAVAHLGYLQIDTIYVIERSHHHILYTRIPTYRREH